MWLALIFKIISLPYVRFDFVIPGLEVCCYLVWSIYTVEPLCRNSISQCVAVGCARDAEFHHRSKLHAVDWYLHQS